MNGMWRNIIKTVLRQEQKKNCGSLVMISASVVFSVINL